MPNKTIYLTDSEDCFCRTKIPDFKEWLKKCILEEREKQRLNDVPKLKHEYHYAKNQQKAVKNALSVLIQKCKEVECRNFSVNGFLTGATGKRLLRDADMDPEQFKTFRMRKSNQVIRFNHMQPR